MSEKSEMRDLLRGRGGKERGEAKDLSQFRREEGAVKRLRGRGCFTVAAATAPALLGQV